MNIKDTILSTRSKNVLRSQGIETVEDLMKFYAQGIDMSSIQNMGKKSLTEINEFCRSNGILGSELKKEISLLELNHRISNALEYRGISNLDSLSTLSDSDLKMMTELTLRDRLILKTVIKTSEIYSTKKPSPTIIVDKIKSEKLDENRFAKIFNFFIKETPSNSNLKFMVPFYRDVMKGHITELEFIFRLLYVYVEVKFGNSYGSIQGVIDINKQKSNNQLIMLFLQNKVRRMVRLKDITKEEASLLMQALVLDEEKWLLSRLLGIYRLSSINILGTHYVVDQVNHSSYLRVLRKVEGLPRKKLVTFSVPTQVADDESFMRLLEITYPISIQESGQISNFKSAIPLVEKIYQRLFETGKPITFEKLWQLEGVNDSSQAGIRIKIIRDKRFIIYGKLGILGLVDWNFKVDQIISGTIPDSTISLIKKYQLSGLSFTSLSKIYSRLGKNLKINSWKSNLTLTRKDIRISNNTALTTVDHSNLDSQSNMVDSIRDRFTRLLDGEIFSGEDIMELALEVALIDYRNFDSRISSKIDSLFNLVRGNVKEIGKSIQNINDVVDFTFLEICFGIKISRTNKSELVLGVLKEMIEDGEITYEERDIIANWIKEGEISKIQVKQALSQGIIDGKLNIDRQIAYIFQYRGVKRLAEESLAEEFRYMLFDLKNVEDLLQRSEGFLLEDGFYSEKTPDQTINRFTLKVVGQDFLIILNKSLWDNVTFEFSEETNGPALTVNSNSTDKYVSLIEDSIISYLIMETLMDPSNINKIRNRINLKLRAQHYQLFE